MFTTFVFGSTIGAVINGLGLAGDPPPDDSSLDDSEVDETEDEDEDELVRQRRLSSHSMQRPALTPMERSIVARKTAAASPLDTTPLLLGAGGNEEGDQAAAAAPDGNRRGGGGDGSSRSGGNHRTGVMEWCRRQDRNVLSKWLGGKHWRLHLAAEREAGNHA